MRSRKTASVVNECVIIYNLFLEGMYGGEGG